MLLGQSCPAQDWGQSWLLAERGLGREDRGERRHQDPCCRGRALLSALTCAPACLTGTPELQAAPLCREGETAWLEGAWLLTSSVEKLASK